MFNCTIQIKYYLLHSSGDGNEYSLDELRARKYEKKRSEVLLEQKKAEMLRLQQQQQQLQQQQQMNQQRMIHQQQKIQQQQTHHEHQHHHQQVQPQAMNYQNHVQTNQVYENQIQPHSHYQTQFHTPQQHSNYIQHAAPHNAYYHPHPHPHAHTVHHHVQMHSPPPHPIPQHHVHSPVHPQQHVQPHLQHHHYAAHPPANQYPVQQPQHYHQQPTPVITHSHPHQHPQYNHSSYHHPTSTPQTPPVQYYNNQIQQQPQQQYQTPTNKVQSNGTTATPQFNYSISQTTVTPSTETETPMKGQKRKKEEDEFDYDEQIEASTIQYYPNSSVKKPTTIRIKFKKEKPNTESPSVPSPSISNIKSMKKPATSTPKSSRKSKKLKPLPIDSGFVPSSESNSTDSQRYHKNIDDANLLLSIANMHSSSNDDSSQSYTYTKPRAQPTIDEIVDEDSYSNSSFNGYSENSNSTPIKSTRFNTSKLATPLQNFKYQNDDSNCSFSAENSYFAAESDEEVKSSRLQKALETIRTHFAKTLLDPFSNELCKAFLTKLNFPPRNDREVCQVINAAIPKFNQMKVAHLGDTVYNVEREVGRGAYGAVYRGINTRTEEVVALKYQKPANSWELYICTEVRKRISNHDLV